MLVMPYFELGLMMEFLERVYMGCWFSGGKDGRVGEMVGIGMGSRGCVTPPTQHQVSSEGVIFFYKLITFKFVHSYNVKHLT